MEQSNHIKNQLWEIACGYRFTYAIIEVTEVMTHSYIINKTLWSNQSKM